MSRTKDIQSLSKLHLPKIIFGTSSLGNLFERLEDAEKFAIVEQCISQSKGVPVFDSAGKYGAGLALEELGKILHQLKVPPDNVVISNKLGWLRTSLIGTEPSFEPGVWKDLKYDAKLNISYEGIIECFDQGNLLLGGYIPQMVSVHDPDEYLGLATGEKHAEQLYEDIMSAYRALEDLKKQGKVQSIGVGAKDWKVIERIAKDINLDWVMIANSLTIKEHPQDLLAFVRDLCSRNIQIINSAIFHSGFLTGGDYYDYKLRNRIEDSSLYGWRDTFFQVCSKYEVKPAAACANFCFMIPGIDAIALNTSSAKRVKENVTLADAKLPIAFWNELHSKGLIELDMLTIIESSYNVNPLPINR